jgi:alanine dehydrogenase
MAVGLGAKVTIIDRNLDRLRQLDDIFLSKVQTLASSPYAIEEAISHADLVIGAVLVVGLPPLQSWLRARMLKLIPAGLGACRCGRRSGRMF